MIGMRRENKGGLLVTGGLAIALVVGCEGRRHPSYTAWASSLATSMDKKLLYAVDTDNDLVVVMSARSERKIAEVKVGRTPERIAVGSDDSIYVSNRGSRSVSVFRRDSWREAFRVPVGVEPVGIAVSPDNKWLYVVNSSSIGNPENGTLSAVDLEKRQEVWSIPLGREPRDIRLLSIDRAEVRARGGNEVVQVDLKARRVLARRTFLSRR